MEIKILTKKLRGFKRKALFSVAGAGLLLQASAQTWESALVKTGSNGKLVYTTDANKNVIPDFSYAGYKNNDEAVPQVTRVIKTLTPQPGDNTAYINNAIAAAASVAPDANGIRGVIFLSKGNYQIAGTIKVNVSGVVLRGAGSSSDPATSTILQATGNSPAHRTVIIAGGGSGSGWNKTGTYQANITDNFVKVGSKELSVASTSGLQVGDNIVIYSPCTSAWINAIGGGGTAGAANWTVNSQPLVFSRVVKAINGLKLTLDAPVFNHLDKNLAQAYIYKVNRAGILTQIGLENFRVDIRNWSNAEADEDHAWEGVGMVQVEDSWATNVVALHFGHAGFRFSTAARITVDNCKALDPVATITPERRYNFNFEDNSTNILVKNCEANKARHAYVSNGTSSVSNIVILRCKAIDNYTSSEGHRRWSMGMLFDNFTTLGFIPGDGRVLGLYSRGNYGTSHGWSLAHSVAWNCNVGSGSITVQQPPTAQNYVIGGYGKLNTSVPFPQYAKGYSEGFNRTDGKTLSPKSLFDQQLADRQTVSNQGPIVKLTAPQSGSNFAAPASITLTADASDVDGTVSKVDFYNGNTLLSSDVTSPYSFSWTGVAAGTYSVSAKATDNSGAVTSSSGISVTVIAAPVCQPAYASSDDGNVAANVLDGDLASRWSASGDEQWLAFCLGSSKTVSGIQIAFYSGNVRQSIFDIQVSNDGGQWTTVSPNVHSSGTSLQLETFAFAAQEARYVRILGHGNSVNAWNSYTEVKIITGSIPVNQPPSITLASPLAGATFTDPASITISADAADADGTITKVDFYNGATLLGSDATTPYSYSWTGVPAGTYSLSAKATDNSGAVTASSSLTVNVTGVPVNQAPTASITSPSNNESYTAAAIITISANAADADGTITKVDFYNGTTLLNSDATTPYTYTWANVAAGTYMLTVKATDNSGAVTTSSVVTVKVNPVVTNTCSGIAHYKENGGYVAGSIVQNSGSRYQCKPYPYSGWCNGAAWAYGPGTGSYWSDAWVLIGSCSGARTGDADMTDVPNNTGISNAPNPFSGATEIEIVVTESGNVSVKIYDTKGLEITTVVEGFMNPGTYKYVYDASGLRSNMYLMKYSSASGTVIRKIMKTE